MVTVSRDTWYTATLIFDFPTEEYSVLLDGTPVGTNLSMSNGNLEFDTGLFASFSTGNDSEYLDNYSVSDT